MPVERSYKLSVFHIKWFFSVNQCLTGSVFSSRPFQTCRLFSFVDIFLVFGQQEGFASYWGLCNINLSKMKIHYNRFWNKLCSLTLLKLSRWPKTTKW